MKITVAKTSNNAGSVCELQVWQDGWGKNCSMSKGLRWPGEQRILKVEEEK